MGVRKNGEKRGSRELMKVSVWPHPLCWGGSSRQLKDINKFQSYDRQQRISARQTIRRSWRSGGRCFEKKEEGDVWCGIFIFIVIIIHIYYRWRPPRRKCNAKAYKWLDDDDDVVFLVWCWSWGVGDYFWWDRKKRKDVMPITSKQLQEMKIIIV